MPDRSCVLSANHTARVDCAWHEEAELSERAFEDDEGQKISKDERPEHICTQYQKSTSF